MKMKKTRNISKAKIKYLLMTAHDLAFEYSQNKELHLGKREKMWHIYEYIGAALEEIHST